MTLSSLRICPILARPPPRLRALLDEHRLQRGSVYEHHLALPNCPRRMLPKAAIANAPSALYVPHGDARAAPLHPATVGLHHAGSYAIRLHMPSAPCMATTGRSSTTCVPGNGPQRSRPPPPPAAPRGWPTRCPGRRHAHRDAITSAQRRASAAQKITRAAPERGGTSSRRGASDFWCYQPPWRNDTRGGC